LPLAITPPIHLTALLPELIVAVAGCVALLCGQGSRAVRQAIPWICVGGLVLAAALLRMHPSGGDAFEIEIRSGLALGYFGDFVRLAAVILGVLFMLAGWCDPTEEEAGEYFSMAMFSLCGLMLLGSAADLLVLFLALEVVSIPTYIMVTLSRRNVRALEAGTKYFYLGALSAAITAYGFSFLYGVAGSATLDQASIDRIIGALHDPSGTAYVFATVGLVLSILGLLFKIAAVPLHFYVADVYQGASSPVAGLLGFVPKIAGLAAIIKLISLTEWQTTSGGLFWMLWIVAALSMTVGNVLALRQTNIKRMLAYSGIAHSGYMLVGLVAGPGGGTGVMGDGTAAVLYYAVIYGIANLGAFALLGLLRVRGQACETLRDVAGLIGKHPGLALLMALAMLTLMGFPPMPGFWGKLSLFGSALAAAGDAPDPTRPWIIGLVIVAVVNSAIGAAYYLRVTAAVLLYENDEPAEPAPREAQHIGVILCGILLLMFSVYPSLLLINSRNATSQLRARPAAAIVETAPPRRDLALVRDARRLHADQ